MDFPTGIISKKNNSLNNFSQEKKTFLSKLDKSKKGSVDERVRKIIQSINLWENYYTTSSCSGRIVLWKGSGKKNEITWVKASHDPITEGFLTLRPEEAGEEMIWLKVEPTILHVCCQNIDFAVKLLDFSRRFYKKSSIYSLSRKIIVEVKGSEFMEMPFYHRTLLYSGELFELQYLVNAKMESMFRKLARFERAFNQEEWK